MNTKKIIAPETVTLKTLSEMFDIPIWTLRKMSAERRLPGLIKLNRSVRVDVAAFRKYLSEHRADTNVG